MLCGLSDKGIGDRSLTRLKEEDVAYEPMLRKHALTVSKTWDGGDWDRLQFTDTRDALQGVLTACSSVEDAGSYLEQIWDVLAALLLLGRTEIGGEISEKYAGYTAGGGMAKLDKGSMQELPECERLLGVGNPGEKNLAFWLRNKFIRGSAAPISRDKARGVQHALIHRLYSSLFDWLVERLNEAHSDLSARQLDDSSLSRLSVLDIFGFERFERNYLEQLCINIANERLQLYFEKQVLVNEVDQCRIEGVELDMGPPNENGEAVCRIVYSKDKPMGVFQLIDEELKVGDAASELNLLQAMKAAHGANKLFKHKQLGVQHKATQGKLTHAMKPEGDSNVFTITHYAGEVDYRVEGLLEKSSEQLTPDLLTLLRTSTKPLVKLLVKPKQKTDPSRADAKADAKAKSVGVSFYT